MPLARHHRTHGGTVALNRWWRLTWILSIWPATLILQALRTHFPEPSAWTEWLHLSHSVTSLPAGATFATTLVLEHARDTWVNTSPTPLRPRASPMMGSLTTGNSSSDPGPSIYGFGLWTSSSLPWRGCVAHGNVKSSARPVPLSACRSLWDGTRRTFTPHSGTTALGSAFGSREHIKRSCLGAGARLRRDALRD